jgi:hypothetical protein
MGEGRLTLAGDTTWESSTSIGERIMVGDDHLIEAVRSMLFEGARYGDQTLVRGRRARITIEVL